MKVKEVLRKKGPQVFTIGQDMRLAEALKVLVANKIGVLLVLNLQGKISGILSERDILRLANSQPDSFREVLVSEAMTKELIFAEDEDDIEYVEAIMTENRIRHVPIMNNKVLVGLISIGDVVKNQLTDKRYENKYLMDYIHGTIPKG